MDVCANTSGVYISKRGDQVHTKGLLLMIKWCAS